MISPSGCVVFTVGARVALGLSLFFRLRREDHVHLLAVELRHHLHLGELFEVRGKAQQQDFSLLLEHDRTTAEKDVGFDLGTLLEEVLGVLQLEVVVVVVGLRSEANLLDRDLRLVGLQLLCLFLLLPQFKPVLTLP